MSTNETALRATTVEALKEYLNISSSDSSKDALFEVLIDSCTGAAEKYLGRYIVAREISQEPHDFDGLKTKYLQLEQYPVISISQIMQDGAQVPSELYRSDNYNGIVKKTTGWRGIVLATYTGGLAQDTASVPKNIQLALWQWIADILQVQENGSLKSESLGDYSAAYYDERALPLSVASLLEGYRRINI
jgi:hypothetical protein